MDGIEREFEAQLSVVRLNVQEPVGRAAAGRLGFRVTPTFILFDGRGRELWRVFGSIDPARIRESLGSQ